MPVTALSPEVACKMLAEAGLALAPSDVHVEKREERWLVHLPGEQLAWFAASAEGLQRLRVERRVLRLLDARCSFRVPRVLFEGVGGEFDVRAKVPGMSDPWRIYREVRDDGELAMRLGTAVGGILAEQHVRIVHADVDGWLPRRTDWPLPQRWVCERLRRVVVGTHRKARKSEQPGMTA